ncbi:MAG: serine protein kinase PrkA [Candidatus Yanofskybacteria bacterium]|nr:serine protein kinase PrkA [Candidatus Yanofskybacteria bacterium]
MEEMGKALESLRAELESKEKRTTLSFREFLEITRKEPERVLRNIFQLFHDMIKSYVGEGINENPDDPESIGFVKYNCSKIFIEEADNPFFADRLFANRFVRQTEGLRQSSQQNRIYVYEGPHGCGKSTFLNNLLKTFEKYTSTREGQSFEIFWEVNGENGQKVGVPCPSHDHPILLIPKNYRVSFIDKLLSENMTELKHRLSCEKEYEWIFKDEVCTICNTLFWSLFDKFGSLDKVLGMVRARSYKFDRRLGEGISVFNPGDKSKREISLSDKQIQDKLDQIFGANLVKYLFSPHARTNNGIYVLMDIKSHNKERLLELHNIISEGVHRVDGIEEHINSLFFALMNPEDKKAIEKESLESFQGRIQYNKIPYVMEVLTEVKIYLSIFGEKINARFLPRILENFARAIISSRMNTDCKPLKEWIPDLKKYKKYCDEHGLLLRMEIYGGIIPPWLSEEDKKKFTAKVRRKLIAEAENEGNKGFSGRESVALFGDFFSRYGSKPYLINMGNVADYFKNRIAKNQGSEQIPQNFIDSLVDWYDYVVLNEVKESLYFYNRDQLSEDILNYLCAVNYDPGNKIKCKFTGKEMEVTVDFLKLIGGCISGKQMDEKGALDLARDIQKRYTEIIAQGHPEITETDLYQELFDSYARNLKENAFRPFLENENFREAIKFYGTKEYDTFDTRLKEHVSYMIKNLADKFGYTEQGAKEIGLYVIERKLVKKFS